MYDMKGNETLTPCFLLYPRPLKGSGVQDLCRVHFVLIERHWNFLLHTKIDFNLKVCHDFDGRSFRQVQDHGKRAKFVPGPYISYLH